MGIRQLFEDAFRIKFLPKEDPNRKLKLTSSSDDLANMQIRNPGTGSIIDAEAIYKFRTLSSDRVERYKEFESLLNDTTIAAAIEMYADDATQYHYQTGKVIWAESDDEDPDVLEAANRLIDTLGINEKAWQHIYALCAYGDVYLRLYRAGDESDYLYDNDTAQAELRVKPADESRKFDEYIEYVDDPAMMYDLQERDLTAGYIKLIANESEVKPQQYMSMVSSYRSDQTTNVNLYDNKSFVHICLPGNIERNPEIIKLTDKNGVTKVYKVKSGKSILADAYDASQTVRLLEDSLVLSRLTKSAVIRILQIEVGNMPKSNTEELLRRYKNHIEQKLAMNVQTGTTASYNSPGPMENIVYFATHEGKGVITPQTIGGDVNIKDIVDLDYFNDKKLSALKIPKQYLNYDAPEGLGNGTSLTKLSSRYAHTIMRIQNAYIAGITQLLNIMLMDKGLDYTNRFKIKMVSPATIEDVERDEQLQNRLTQSGDILGLIESHVDDAGSLEVVKWLLTKYLNLPEVSAIVEECNVQHNPDADSGKTGVDIDMSGESHFGDESPGFSNGGGLDFGDTSDMGETPSDISSDLSGSTETSVPELEI